MVAEALDLLASLGIVARVHIPSSALAHVAVRDPAARANPPDNRRNRRHPPRA